MVSVNVNELVPCQWLATPFIACNWLMQVCEYNALEAAELAHGIVGNWVDYSTVCDLEQPYGELITLPSDSQRHVVTLCGGRFQVSAAPLESVYVDAGGQCWASKAAFC